MGERGGRGEVARRNQKRRRLREGDVGPAEYDSTCRQGRLVTEAAWASPAASRAGRSGTDGAAARSAYPNRPRTGNPPQRMRELAGARTAGGHEHQGESGSRGLVRQKPKPLAPARFGEKCAPEPPPGTMGVSRNLSRAPAASLRDRLRRLLTEAVRRCHRPRPAGRSSTRPM
jgi:hypothetical protein